MTKRTYSQNLEYLIQLIEERGSVEPPSVVTQLLETQTEIVTTLKEMNGSQRGNREAIIAISQWKQDYEKSQDERYGEVCDRVGEVNGRVNRCVVGNVTIATVLTGVSLALQEGIKNLKAWGQ